MSRKLIFTGAAILAVAALAALAWRSHESLPTGLPPRVECLDVADAGIRSAAYASAHGARIVGVLGTGSMAPYIPAAPAGHDPRLTIVAYAAIKKGAAYGDVKKGQLVVYEYVPVRGSSYMHAAAERDALGWIMSGLNNARSEVNTRVTNENFKGIVTQVFVWPL